MGMHMGMHIGMHIGMPYGHTCAHACMHACLQVEERKKGLVVEASRQCDSLSLKGQPLGLELGPSLEMWQLPAELLGVSGGAEDVVSLKAEIARLKALVAKKDAELAASSRKVTISK